MSAPTLALALLTTPLPEPAPCAALPVVSHVAADVFGRGFEPRLVGINDPGGPFQLERWEQNQRLADRFGDVMAVEQVDRHLGSR